MEIVIIGTGNTASVLGRKLRNAGHRIVQVFGRDTSEASQLAYELDTESTNYWNVVYRDADLYILAVSDIAIREILEELQLPDKTIVHTAASVSKDVLRNSAKHFGVFYPLQSLRKDLGHLPNIPIIIEERKKLHLAAVVVNNFVNHLYALAESYCNNEGIDFNLLLPLIKETAERLNYISPSQSQTGPALRNDKETIKAHLELLKKYPHLKKIYETFTDSIYTTR